MSINPYQPPEDDSGPAAQSLALQTRPLASFESLLGLAKVVQTLMLVVTVVKVLCIGGMMLVLAGMKEHNSLTGPNIPSSAAFLGIAGLIDLGACCLTGLFYLAWVYRAYSNLPALGVIRLESTPGWAVAHYFLPILCLYRPYQAMVEIMRGSTLRDARSGRKPSTALAGWWWAGWIISGLLGQYSGLVLGSYEISPITLEPALWIELAAQCVSILTAFFAIKMVLRVSDDQEEKHFAGRTTAVPARPSFEGITLPPNLVN